MEQVKAFVKRLHLPVAVGEKALEYCRLAEVKCCSGSRGAISPSCLAIICIDLTCVQLGEPFDKKLGQRLSGVSSKVYLTSYQTVEKLLNVSSGLSLKDLAVRFGCLEAQPLAETLLENYKVRIGDKYTAAQKASLDLTKTLYQVAALYYACKLLKIRCEKSKFQASSTSTRHVFQNVLDEMNHCTPKNIDKFKLGGRGKSKKVTGGADVDGEGGEGHRGVEMEQRREEEAHEGRRERERRQLLEGRMQSNPTSQRYLQWKEATLRLARDNPCPNLEGIKDALFYKFRRPTIGQNCCAACTNKGGHRDAFSPERTARSASRFERPAQQATEPRVKRETRSVLRHSLVVHGRFDRART